MKGISIALHCDVDLNNKTFLCILIQVQNLGLVVQYQGDSGTRSLLRQLLCLPLLPHQHITAVFLELQAKATTEPLQQLCEYISETWINSTVWSPKQWSVYGLAVRTNNDVEGWHRRFNERASSGQLNLYLLIQLMHKEAELVNLQVATFKNLKYQNK